jgi:hypothetical protein
MSKKKFNHQAHGKFEDEEMAPTTLDQVWNGFNELSEYGTLDKAEYEQQLAEMNRTDLHAHARAKGLVPIDNTERLKKNLVQKFDAYAFYLRKPIKKSPTPKAPTKDITAILSEGR